jgi:arginyl-tRNA synthetase
MRKSERCAGAKLIGKEYLNAKKYAKTLSMERFKPALAQALLKAIQTLDSGLEYQVLTKDLETPPDRKMGDFAFPCFRLSKLLKKAPPVIAAELTAAVAPLVTSAEFEVKQVGPYVNFTVKQKALVETVVKDILSSANGHFYGELPKNSREKWVFEYSSPNVAKPFQIYHLRTTIVGSALSKIARVRGYDVTTINHLGDWGTQYGKLAIALKKYANELPEKLTLADLVRVYIQIHKDIEADPSIEKAGQEAFRKLEEGDPEMRAIWKKCVDISVSEFKKTYARFQVEFDHYWGESFYEAQLKPLMADLRARGILVQDQGAGVVFVKSRDGHEIPPCILEKSDGASIYASRDVAAAVYRFEKFHFKRMSYVVGKEQKLHFEQVFGVLRAMNLPWEAGCEHIATGLYRFKDAKMSTRKGNFITLDEVNEMCVEKALNLMRERDTGGVPADASGEAMTNAHLSLSEADLKLIADQVAIGAIVFADLSTDPAKDLELDLDRVISFEGETGPYLQYAHTRCISILKRVGLERSATGAFHVKADFAKIEKLCSSEIEMNLMRTLGKFPGTLEHALENRKPSHLATHLIDITRDFGNFYRECKVLHPDNADLTNARAALVESTRLVLGQGLDLLGIPKPEKM